MDSEELAPIPLYSNRENKLSGISQKPCNFEYNKKARNLQCSPVFSQDTSKDTQCTVNFSLLYYFVVPHFNKKSKVRCILTCTLY